MSTAITPTTSATYRVGRTYHNVPHDSRSFAPDVGKRLPHFRLKLVTKYFSGIDNGNNWSGLRGVVAAAWQPNELTDVGGIRVDAVNAITMTSGGPINGWVHALVGGTFAPTSASSAAPVTKGTAGYTQPGFMFKNHKSAAPNTLTLADVVNHAGYEFQIIPFTTSTADDVWNSETLRLCPGIVAVAWQANVPSSNAEDRVAVTLDAAGDVIFTSSGGGGDGWLWVWRCRN